MFYVYILKSKFNGTFYRGQTNNLEGRLIRHNNRQEKATARYAPWEIVWFCKKTSRSEAVILEKKLKNLSIKRLEEFIKKYPIQIGPDDADNN